MNALHLSAFACVRISELLIAVPLGTSAAEYLSVRALLVDGGLLGQQNLPANRAVATLQKRRIGQWMLQYSVLVAALLVKFLSAVLLVACIAAGKSPFAAMVILVGASALCHIRLRATLDAGESFAMLCLVALSAAEGLHTLTSMHIVLAFLAAQGVLVYATAGLPKMFHRGWYNGKNVFHVLSNAQSGNEQLRAWLKRTPSLATAAGTLLVAVECLLAFAPLLPPSVCLAVLLCGVALHVTIARVIGLKTYMWAFAATYPAMYFFSTRIYAAR